MTHFLERLFWWVTNAVDHQFSYNGGRGGTEARPTAEDRAIAKEQHFAPTPLQRKQVETASQDPNLFKGANNGVPAVGATARPGELNGPGVVCARPTGEIVPANLSRTPQLVLIGLEPSPNDALKLLKRA